jgi:thiol-disulfide isomerase/thioredoxin
MGRRAATRALGAASLVVVFALAGCTGEGGNASGLRGDGTSFVSGDGVKTMVPVARRQEPVELTATTLEGDRLDIATLRGKPVVLNVWGSWCPPCRKEAPALQAAAAQLRGKASFVGINTRDSEAGAQAYERRFKVSYPSLVDKGTLLLALRGAVSPQDIPSTLVLDRQGRVAARFSGPVTMLTVTGMVADVAASS